VVDPPEGLFEFWTPGNRGLAGENAYVAAMKIDVLTIFFPSFSAGL
jgi:hypothetical protein